MIIIKTIPMSHQGLRPMTNQPINVHFCISHDAINMSWSDSLSQQCTAIPSDVVSSRDGTGDSPSAQSSAIWRVSFAH